ncbi:DgyrCDS10613 [Dimorphilus gyrociliatus]|uniref:DgyrCDS10613 n=1 Tax=Dimorphilus gyrociliatus TaxID=2664684 RepID=A0A7I8W255_9ANNE|nr:DgyrCDS10613 [Dimorphilus gyrociliatus]
MHFSTAIRLVYNFFFTSTMNADTPRPSSASSSRSGRPERIKRLVNEIDLSDEDDEGDAWEDDKFFEEYLRKSNYLRRRGTQESNSLSDYESVDNFSTTVSCCSYRSIEKFVKDLTSSFSLKKDKIRAIYSWLVHNYNRVDCCRIRRELTLLKMCSLVNIQCEIVHGYRKSENFIPGDKLNELYRHQWNLVTFDDINGLIDVKTAFSEPYGIDYFFLTKPENLIISHLPDKVEHQLLANKINEEKFRNSIRSWPAKFALSIKTLAPMDGVGFIQTKTGKFSVKLRARRHSLSSTLVVIGLHGEKRVDEYVDHRISNIEEEEVFDLVLPAKTRYILTIVVQEEDVQLPVQQYTIDYQ